MTLMLCALLSLPQAAEPGWSQWLGPNRDGRSPEKIRPSDYRRDCRRFQASALPPAPLLPGPAASYAGTL